ncbi:N-acetylmuramoyl-L-alanine amidase-like domain-containing protein [Salinibacter altiplanensis]|uniref:N-acetylmuramoyl-L-alanine amidase-like domain-containing protein n=1 Tax=Salinibacter altiplanensis TaxID=1803181 RepID=UPI000C9F09E4|nr:N-acetylmuramoyl-L-alanine amidase-like domain-containing protein [Salinibacter altiplanensis]
MPSPLRFSVAALPELLVGLALLAGCQPTSDATTEAASPQRPDAPPPLSDSVLSPPDTTANRFEAALETALSHRDDAGSIGALMQNVGRHFHGRPYRTGTLDAPETETLVVRFDGFDCVTFVETALALARSAQASDTTYAGFAGRLAEQRYRDGGSVGYCGRLHYFTEWITNNAKRGRVQRLGAALGGRPLRDTLDFMSTHRSAYDRVATNDSLFACVQDMETRLQSQQRRNPVRYVPQDSIRAVYDQLRAGDIVALVSSIDGLDVAHTGLVYAHPDDRSDTFGLLHASLSDGVTVSPDLQRYVQTIDHQIGMVVARPQPVQ